MDTAPYIAHEYTKGPFDEPRVYRWFVDGENRPKSQVVECNEILHGQFIVRDEKECKYLVFNSYEDYTRWFVANPKIRTLHETIVGTHRQKLKFDIDAETAKLDSIEFAKELPLELPNFFIDDVSPNWWKSASLQSKKSCVVFDIIVRSIVQCFDSEFGHELTPEDFAICDSTDQTKFSRHVVILNYYAENSREAQFFTQRLFDHLPQQLHKLLDAGVNKSRQNFRLPDCHKVGSTRVKRCIWGSVDGMIITKDLYLALPRKVAACKHYEETTVDEAAIIKMAEPYADGLVFRAVERGLFCYKRERPGYCKICERTHDKDNTLFLSVNKDGYVRAHCHRNANKNSICIGRVGEEKPKKKPRVYGEEIRPSKFKPWAKIPQEFSLEQYCESYLREFTFKGNKYDTLLIKSNMGTGKTKQLVEHLKTIPAEMRVVFVSFRRSFTTEIMSKLDGSFVDYRDVKGNITAPRVVIQFESLHRLVLPVGQPSLLVLDESESIIGQLENRQENLRSCWEHFQWLVTNATKVIAMDAFADFRTYILLSLTRKLVHMHYNTFVAENGPTDMYYEPKDRAAFLDAVFTAAKSAKTAPFVVVSTAKKQSDAIALGVQKMCPDAKVRYYNKNSTVEDRKDFDNVNEAWADVDILIYTPTISAGCSFELPRFKKVFAYFSSKSVDYKTAIQMLGRVRDIESREYHIYIKSVESDLPDTVQEVEKVIAKKETFCDLATNPLNMPKMINAVGEHEYTLKDLYYHLHVGNLVHRCQSRNRFRWLFQQLRAAMGAKLVVATPEKPTEDVQEITEGHKDVIKALTVEENQKIAAVADWLTDEEAERLSKTDILTPELQNALTAHKLTKFYDVKPEMVTPEFVAEYNNVKVKRVFHNLNQLSQMSQMSITDAVKKWREVRGASKPKKSIDDLSQTADNMLRCMFAVDILNGLLSSPDEQYCSRRHFEEVEVTREVLEQKIDVVIGSLQANVNVVSLIFGCRKNNILAEKADLGGKLKLINPLLEATFGVKIAGVGRKGVRNNYRLVEQTLFTRDQETGRYMVASTS